MTASETFYFVLHCNGKGCGAAFAGRKNEPMRQLHLRAATLGWTQVRNPGRNRQLDQHFCLHCQENGNMPAVA